MNRAEKRRMEKLARKAQLQAKRKAEKAGIAVPQLERKPQQSPEVTEHERLNQARIAGRIVPPSPAERAGLAEKGHKVPQMSGGGLYLP